MFFIVVFWIMAVFIGIILYAVGAYGLYTLAQNRSMENAWLAWVPIGNLYLLGVMIDHVVIADIPVRHLDLILPVGFVLTLTMSPVIILSQLLWVAFGLVFLMSLYRLYYSYRPASAVLYTVLSALMLFPVLLFIIKDDAWQDAY